MADGNKYEGEWQDDKPNGHGTFIWADGDKYEGEYRNDKPNGHGTYYTKTPLGFKITQQGQWRNNEFIG